MVEHLNAESFKKKVFDINNGTKWKFNGERPCVIDFYADWCGPCKMVAPVLEELSKDYGGRVDVYKVNTDEEQELAMAFGIQSIPSMLFIPMKGDPRMSVGAMSKQGFEKVFDELLQSGNDQVDTQKPDFSATYCT